MVDRLVHDGSDTVTLDITIASPTQATRFESCGFALAARRPLIFTKSLDWHARPNAVVVSTDPEYTVNVFDGASLQPASSIRRALEPREATFELAMEWAVANPVTVSSRQASVRRHPRKS